MGIFPKLRIAGEGVDFEGLEKAFDTGETHVCRNGGVFYNKYEKKDVIYGEDVFTFSKDYADGLTESAVLEDFISELLRRREVITEAAGKHRVSLCISLYPDDYYQSIGFPAGILERVSRLGVEMYVEVYFLKDIYEGNG